MANLTETATWEANVYEWAPTDPLQAGPGGIDNLPTSQLANRTQWLKGKVDALLAGDFQLKDAVALSSNTTLNASHMGAFLVLTGSTNVTVTLPAYSNAAALKDGQAFIIKNNTTSLNPSVIATSDTGVFDVSGDTEMSLEKEDTAIVIYRANASNPSGAVGTYHAIVIKGQTVPSGTVTAFAGSAIPYGYLKCDGSLYNKADYPALADVLGLTYGDPDEVGGNSSTQFLVPNLRGQFIRGLNGGVNNNGGTSTVDAGRTLGSTQLDELKSHRHTVKKINRQTGTSATGFFAMDDNGNDGSEFTENTGGAETRPTNVAMNYIIKW